MKIFLLLKSVPCLIGKNRRLKPSYTGPGNYLRKNCKEIMIMFRKKYKEDFDSITPNDEFINNLAKKLANSSPANRPGIRKQLVAGVVIAAVAVCVLMGGNIISQYLNAPSFTLVAYA